MARTNDPSAATKKAWLSRARASGGGGVVQQRGDFAYGGALSKASAKDITDLISGADNGPTHHPMEQDDKIATAGVLAKGVKGLDIPERALKSLSGIEMASDRQMHDFGERYVSGAEYNTRARRIRINATYNQEESVGPEETARLLAHEIGHHVSTSRLKDAAGIAWMSVHQEQKARISKYAKKDWDEHFSEAFAAYATKSGRRKLKKLEPLAYAFMERLWQDPGMWKG